METVRQIASNAGDALKKGMGLKGDEKKVIDRNDELGRKEEKWQLKSEVDKDDAHGMLKVTPMPKLHPTETMLAMEWNGKEDVSVKTRAKPMITDPKDVILRITATTVCGSDLHMYYNKVPAAKAMRDGDILGHEFMGVIEEVGPEVKNFKVGDRVVSAFHINCGECQHCLNKQPTLCDCTNPSMQMEALYGHRIAGAFGYTHVTGAFPGGQAEYVRRPFADCGLIKVPDNLRDEQVLLLSDVLCTGWHATVCADLNENDTVCIWGAGPIGLSCCYLSIKIRKCKRVIVIDNDESRLRKAQSFGAEVINFDKVDSVVDEIFRLVPGGPDACCDCAGFRFPKTAGHKIMFGAQMETDTSEIFNEMFKVVKKGGRIGLVGDYFGWCNQFPIGMYMEKNIVMRGSQAFVTNYMEFLLEKIKDGTIDPTVFFTHVMPLEKIAEAYKIFGERQDDALKILITTKFSDSRLQELAKKGKIVDPTTMQNTVMQSNVTKSTV